MMIIIIILVHIVSESTELIPMCTFIAVSDVLSIVILVSVDESTADSSSMSLLVDCPFFYFSASSAFSSVAASESPWAHHDHDYYEYPVRHPHLADLVLSYR